MAVTVNGYITFDVNSVFKVGICVRVVFVVSVEVYVLVIVAVYGIIEYLPIGKPVTVIAAFGLIVPFATTSPVLLMIL